MAENRDLLLREAYHRMKNDLNGLYALAREAECDGIAAHIQSLSALYALLEAGGTGLVKLGGYLHEVAGLRTRSLGLDYRMESFLPEDVDLPHRTAAGLGLALSELLVNASKHAYNRGRGAVLLRVDRRGRFGVVSLEDGACSPGGVEFAEGNGLALVRGVLGDIGGTLALHRDAGVRCVIEFLLHN